jgi:hypothetical protein
MRIIVLLLVLGIIGFAIGFLRWGQIGGSSITWQSLSSLSPTELLQVYVSQPSLVYIAALVGAVIGSAVGLTTRKKPQKQSPLKEKASSVQESTPRGDVGYTKTTSETFPARSSLPPAVEQPFICRLLGVLTLGILRFYVVPQGNALVVTAFGKYRKSVQPGLSPILSLWGIYHKPWGLITTRETIEQLPDESVFTSDGIRCRIAVMICYKIIDPGKALFEVDDYSEAIQTIIQAVLRNESGKLPARSLLSSREQMAETLRATLAADAEPWGINVRLVEITQIDITALSASKPGSKEA